MEQDTMFVLNTNSNCFLCLQQISSSFNQPSSYLVAEVGNTIKIEIDSAPSPPLENYTLSSIKRYLNISPSKIFSELETQSNIRLDEQFLSSSEKLINFSVSLCTKCGIITKQLTELCRELELIQMKTDQCLESFYQTLQKSEGDSSKFQDRISDPVHGNLVEILRQEIKHKCPAKLKGRLPKVNAAEEDKTPLGIQKDPVESTVPLEIPPIIVSAPPKITLPESLTTNSTLQKLPCPLCSKMINSDCLQRHKTFDCELGPKVVKDQTKVKCHLCHAIVHRASFKRHLWSIHKVNKSDILSSPTSPSTQDIRVCTYCDPPRKLKPRGLTRHQVIFHLDSLFLPQKLPHLTQPDFKLFVDYVFKREVGSFTKLQNDDGDPKMKCRHCRKIFQIQDNAPLYDHLYSAHKQVMADNIVQLQNTSSVQDVQEKTRELPSERWECSACGKTFSQASTWNRHKLQYCKGYSKEDDDDKEKIYECDVCALSFRHRRNMLRHKRSAHGHLTVAEVQDNRMAQDEINQVSNWYSGNFADETKVEIKDEEEEDEMEENEFNEDPLNLD